MRIGVRKEWRCAGRRVKGTRDEDVVVECAEGSGDFDEGADGMAGKEHRRNEDVVEWKTKRADRSSKFEHPDTLDDASDADDERIVRRGRRRRGRNLGR